MKRKKLVMSLSLLSMSCIALASCSGVFDWIDDNLFGKGDDNGAGSEIIVADSDNHGKNTNVIADHDMFGVDIATPSNRLTPFDEASQEDINKVYSDGLDIREKYNKNYMYKTPTKGSPHVLVVPILFKGTGLDDNIWNERGCRKWLTQAFFGSSESMEFESLSSYYNKASFGSLNITGEVSQIYNSKYSYGDLKNCPEEEGYDKVNRILADIYDVFFKSGVYNIDDFDDNKDGVIDGIYAIYLNFHDVDSCLWAYQTALSYQYRNHRPGLDNYVWMSFDFFENLSHPNSQTVIHESGHMLGLDDYYNYYDQELTLPCGGVDMMDYNVGYQESFSSYALGWTVPKVIDNNTTSDVNSFNLRPFCDTGDSLIIASNFNGTSFDEYLIMEYYTVNGLNEYFVSPSNTKTQEINRNGILIYHVDQRLGIMEFDPSQGWVWSGRFTDRIVDSQDSFSLVVASNGMSIDGKEGSSYSGFNLVSLLDGNARNGYNKFEHKMAVANATTLFDTNDLFSTHYPNFTFNDGTSLDWEIKIGKMNKLGCEVTVSRK